MTEQDHYAAMTAQLAAQTEQIKHLADQVATLYAALMEKQPGQDKNLLDRMAAVTIAIEGGQSTGKVLVWVAGVLAAIGGIWAYLHVSNH